MTETTVQIPGEFLATYVDGAITGWTFTPAASAAGYFGREAWVVEGDDELDVTTMADDGGAFWQAVQSALNEGAFHPARPPQAGPALINVAWEE